MMVILQANYAQLQTNNKVGSVYLELSYKNTSNPLYFTLNLFMMDGQLMPF